MSYTITTKDHKILRYIKKHPCSCSDSPIQLGETAKYRFEELYSLGYFEPASYTKNEFGEITSTGIYKLSPKGLAYFENRWSLKVEDTKAFIKREIITIVTAFITAAATTYILPEFINLCKLLLMQLSQLK